ncbi:response regulator [Ferroacidibacillus organovorans]|uniref:DNA-binding response regulator n=1 Tax=Ferroacidibacillus organovorans TaxID=1765683 RepID=A0A161QGU8_9BACL|nr:response regulator transcription factor [Ferroacidibacillus organovorans]KYP81370.1 DNA-binding response regulator [Ferroacidibacillus organovorans]OAG95157.1 two-component system response regulator [Ferroacidibacillus organovorans]OPG15149.1 DNA-binding response regulator [Ferroacidibacillus organovorans]
MSDSENANSNTIRVLIVDDHELFRQGVSAMISRHPAIEVVGEASNGQEAVSQFTELTPDVVIMDINMPIMTGLEATRLMREKNSEARILILTVSDAEQALFEAVKAGASGYILKNASPQTVIDSVQRVFSGEPVIPGNLAVKIIHELSASTAKKAQEIDPLTEREIDVLRHLSTGSSNRDIASALYISENTVRNHVRNILEKLHLSNRVQAATYALREGYTLRED